MKPTQAIPPPPPPQWALDLSSPPPKAKGNNANIPNPPGFSATAYKTTPSSSKSSKSEKKPITRPQPSASETATLKLKKAWETSLAPAKQLPMQVIMMYMSGNSLQIFSIMMVFMLFKGPIQGILATGDVYKRFEVEGMERQLWGAKAVYIVMQLGLMALGVWKVNAMGLLPTTRSDWLAWEVERESVERAYFAFS